VLREGWSYGSVGYLSQDASENEVGTYNFLGEKKDYGNRHEETTSGSRTTRRTDTEASRACFVNIIAATVPAAQASDAGRAS
jgi:hypothetical protein